MPGRANDTSSSRSSCDRHREQDAAHAEEPDRRRDDQTTHPGRRQPEQHGSARDAAVGEVGGRGVVRGGDARGDLRGVAVVEGGAARCSAAPSRRWAARAPRARTATGPATRRTGHVGRPRTPPAPPPAGWSAARGAARCARPAARTRAGRRACGPGRAGIEFTIPPSMKCSSPIRYGGNRPGTAAEASTAGTIGPESNQCSAARSTRGRAALERHDELLDQLHLEVPVDAGRAARRRCRSRCACATPCARRSGGSSRPPNGPSSAFDQISSSRARPVGVGSAAMRAPLAAPIEVPEHRGRGAHRRPAAP